jgi:peptidoglycan/LPS O-acetylase OafA/YrhL
VYFNKNESIAWRSYLSARVARIFPLYYLTFIVMLVFPVYSYVKFGSKYIGSGFLNKIFSNILMFSGLMGEKGSHTFNPPAWSISVEFFCYLFIFPLLYYITKIIISNKYYFAASIVFVMILTRLLVVCYRFHEISIYGIEWDSSNLARGVFGFSVGFFLCAIYSKIANFRLSPFIADVITISLILIYSLTSLKIIPTHLLLYTVPPLVLVTAFDRGLIAGVLKTKGLQWLGERSYSIYLWHMPMMGMLCFFLKIFQIEGKYTGGINCIFLIMLTLIISEISYRYFETPCRYIIRKSTSNNNPR